MEKKFSYTQKDYESIKDDLIARAKDLSDWTDFSDNDFGTLLIKLFATMGDSLYYHIDRIANEAFLPTAQEEDSIYHHAQLTGYVPKGAYPAETWVKLSWESAPTELNIPLLLTFKGNANLGDQGTQDLYFQWEGFFHLLQKMEHRVNLGDWFPNIQAKKPQAVDKVETSVKIPIEKEVSNVFQFFLSTSQHDWYSLPIGKSLEKFVSKENGLEKNQKNGAPNEDLGEASKQKLLGLRLYKLDLQGKQVKKIPILFHNEKELSSDAIFLKEGELFFNMEDPQDLKFYQQDSARSSAIFLAQYIFGVAKEYPLRCYFPDKEEVSLYKNEKNEDFFLVLIEYILKMPLEKYLEMLPSSKDYPEKKSEKGSPEKELEKDDDNFFEIELSPGFYYSGFDIEVQKKNEETKKWENVPENDYHIKSILEVEEESNDDYKVYIGNTQKNIENLEEVKIGKDKNNRLYKWDIEPITRVQRRKIVEKQELVNIENGIFTMKTSDDKLGLRTLDYFIGEYHYKFKVLENKETSKTEFSKSSAKAQEKHSFKYSVQMKKIGALKGAIEGTKKVPPKEGALKGAIEGTKKVPPKEEALKGAIEGALKGEEENKKFSTSIHIKVPYYELHPVPFEIKDILFVKKYLGSIRFILKRKKKAQEKLYKQIFSWPEKNGQKEKKLTLSYKKDFRLTPEIQTIRAIKKDHTEIGVFEKVSEESSTSSSLRDMLFKSPPHEPSAKNLEIYLPIIQSRRYLTSFSQEQKPENTLGNLQRHQLTLEKVSKKDSIAESGFLCFSTQEGIFRKRFFQYLEMLPKENGFFIKREKRSIQLLLMGEKKSSTLFFRGDCYGKKGNIGKGAISSLVSESTGVNPDKVENPVASTEGQNAEGIQEIIQNIPLQIARQERLVSYADYESFLREFKEIQHIKISPHPHFSHEVEIYLATKNREPLPFDLRQAIENRIEEQRLLTTRVVLKDPSFADFSMKFTVFLVSGITDSSSLVKQLKEKISTQVHQLGFGSSVDPGVIYQVATNYPEIRYIDHHKISRGYSLFGRLVYQGNGNVNFSNYSLHLLGNQKYQAQVDSKTGSFSVRIEDFFQKKATFFSKVTEEGEEVGDVIAFFQNVEDYPIDIIKWNQKLHNNSNPESEISDEDKKKLLSNPYQLGEKELPRLLPENIDIDPRYHFRSGT